MKMKKVFILRFTSLDLTDYTEYTEDHILQDCENLNILGPELLELAIEGYGQVEVITDRRKTEENVILKYRTSTYIHEFEILEKEVYETVLEFLLKSGYS